MEAIDVWEYAAWEEESLARLFLLGWGFLHPVKFKIQLFHIWQNNFKYKLYTVESGLKKELLWWLFKALNFNLCVSTVLLYQIQTSDENVDDTINVGYTAKIH